MENAKKWSVKDVITLVLMTVLLIVIQLGINMICMVNDFVSMVLSVGITMLVCGPVYFLMVNRIHKRFVSLVYMTLLGLVFLIMGNWFLLPWFIVVGILAELILWKGITPNRLTASWTVSSLLYNGVNLLPVWFFLGYLLQLCDCQRYGAELYRRLCSVLYSAGLGDFYPDFYHALRVPGQPCRTEADSKAFQKSGGSVNA